MTKQKQVEYLDETEQWAPAPASQKAILWQWVFVTKCLLQNTKQGSGRQVSDPLQVGLWLRGLLKGKNKEAEVNHGRVTFLDNSFGGQNVYGWTSLVAQWLRIRLPMQGTWVWSLVREDPTCSEATKPVCHKYWACMLQLLKPARLEPVLRNKRNHHNEKPMHHNEE